MECLYAFEAKEIQKYILLGDKLKEMVGGSELVNQLCEEHLITCLEELGMKDKYTPIAQAAGWAKISFNEKEQAERFRRAWPLLVDRYAPGLQVVQAMEDVVDGDISAAMTRISKSLLANRNMVRASLPEIGPYVARNPRTGFAATDWVRGDDKDSLTDRQTSRKLDKKFTKGESLTHKLTDETTDTTAWPLDMEKIAKDGKGYIAIIHADGNELGSTLMRVVKNLGKGNAETNSVIRSFSDAVSAATIYAARAAYNEVLKKDYDASKDAMKSIAARPLVLGGDDLTIIVRADLAFDFVDVFLTEFERASEDALSNNLGKYEIEDIPPKLTACAGIAFVKKAFPFHMGYELAESLCGYTKKTYKDARASQDDPVPSGYSFFKVLSGTGMSYEGITEEQLTSRDGNLKLWFGPYCTGSQKTAPYAGHDELKALAETLRKLPSGSIRELISVMYSGRDAARVHFDRILEVAGMKKAEAFKQRLNAMTGDALWDKNGCTPLFDAHIMHDLCWDDEDRKGAFDGEG